MTRPLHSIGVAVLGITLLAATAVVATPEPEGVERPVVPAVPAAPWTTVAASGPVEAWPAEIEDEQWLQVVRGDELEPRTAVRTGDRARATLTRQSDILMLDPDSRVALPAGGILDGDSSVVQQRGSVLYEIDGSFHRDFRVITPQLVAGVKGTVFMVTVTDGYAAVSVEEGLVEVTSRQTGERVEIRAGETVLIDARDTAEMELVSERSRHATIDRDSRRLARDEVRRMARALDTLGDSLGGGAVADLLGDEDAAGSSLQGEFAATDDTVLRADDTIDELGEDLADKQKRVNPNQQQANPGGN